MIFQSSYGTPLVYSNLKNQLKDTNLTFDFTLKIHLCDDASGKYIHYIFLFLGADGRIHSVTKYSPLYIAAYNGRRDIVDILLKRFPNLINVLTVEKWSPLHAAVINGHVSTLDLLLRFSYPKECLKTMRDKKGEHIVRLLFLLFF